MELFSFFYLFFILTKQDTTRVRVNPYNPTPHYCPYFYEFCFVFLIFAIIRNDKMTFIRG